jgi:hypothetical protein
MVQDAFRHLRDVLGADSPADNFFIREATICAQLGLVQVGDRWSTDARSNIGEEIEIKSTRFTGRGISFPTSRNVSATVIRRFREADWWAFGLFDVYEELIALYRVDADKMQPLIDELDRKRIAAEADPDRKELNNPKLPFSKIRPLASEPRLYFDSEHYDEVRTSNGSYKIVRKPSAPPEAPLSLLDQD